MDVIYFPSIIHIRKCEQIRITR